MPRLVSLLGFATEMTWVIRRSLTAKLLCGSTDELVRENVGREAAEQGGIVMEHEIAAGEHEQPIRARIGAITTARTNFARICAI